MQEPAKGILPIKLKRLKGNQVTQVDNYLIRNTSDLHNIVQTKGRHTLCLQKPVAYTEAPEFLGILLDEGLTFIPHRDRVLKRFRDRINVIKRLAGTSWGCDYNILRPLLLTFAMPVAQYCYSVYGSFLPEYARKPLDTTQAVGARTVTGCLKTTPIQALFREANIIPLTHQVGYHAAKLMSKLSRLPLSNGHRALRGPPNSRPNWRSTARNFIIQSKLESLPMEILPEVPRIPPWHKDAHVSFCPTLGAEVKRTDSKEKRLQAVLKTIEELGPADAVAYTDGSAKGGTKNGGSGLHITIKHITTEGTHAAGLHSSSYKAEIVALAFALNKLNTLKMPTRPKIHIYTDSQSSVKQLQEGSHAQNGEYEYLIWQSLNSITRRLSASITIQYVPGHCGLPGNELADSLANRASDKEPQDGFKIDIKIANATLRNELRRQWDLTQDPTHLHNVVKRGRRPYRDKELSRRDDVALARLRTGHSTLLKTYNSSFTFGQPFKGQPLCPCGTQEDLQHLLLNCPIYHQTRLESFKNDVPKTLNGCFQRSKELIEFLKVIGRHQPPPAK